MAIMEATADSSSCKRSSGVRASMRRICERSTPRSSISGRGNVLSVSGVGALIPFEP